MSCVHLTGRHNLPAKSGPAVGGDIRASHSMPQKFLAIFCRADSIHLAERSREVLLRFEAAGYCDIQDTRLGRAQHFLGTLYPMTQDEAMRAFAGGLAKHAREMSCAQLHGLGHLAKGQLLFYFGVYELFDPSHACAT